MKTAWTPILLLGCFVIAARAEKRELTFNGADGTPLKATFYATENPGPGVLLLHECKGSRQLYDHLAGMLNTAGYSVLSFDSPGSTGKATARSKSSDTARNVEAAIDFLKTQSKVNPRALGVLAADCTVAEALRAGARHPEIRTLVLLSGAADAEGEAYVKNATKVPILGVASEEDKDAAAAVKKLVALSPDTDSQLEMLKDTGHAAEMLSKQQDLEPDIVVWFRRNLSVAGYGLPPAIK